MATPEVMEGPGRWEAHHQRGRQAVRRVEGGDRQLGTVVRFQVHPAHFKQDGPRGSPVWAS